MEVSEAKKLLERLVDENDSIPHRQARNALKSYEYRLLVALTNIKKSVDRLAEAVQRGVYDARSTVGDEVLNMLQEYENLDR